MRYFILLFLVTFSFIAQAQEVAIDGVTYKVKGETIFKDGIDITKTMTAEEKTEIKSILENKIKLEKEEKEREARIKKAENKQKAAEKALKKKKKAHSNFEKADKKHKEAISKYEKLKKKGKLSPEDEGKWLKKIENYKKDLEKAKKKM